MRKILLVLLCTVLFSYTLPSRFGYVALTSDKNKTIIEWQTLTEVNSNKFVILRSEDGRNFVPIYETKTLAPNNNATYTIQYRYVHTFK